MSKDITVPNPQAFPSVLPPDEKKGWEAVHFEGMTLRDYFASKAMQSIILQYKGNVDADRIADQSYIMSDAMLIARNKQK